MAQNNKYKLRKCKLCTKPMRRYRLSKEKEKICYSCYTKVYRMVNSGKRKGYSLQEALEKVYEIKGYKHTMEKNGIKYYSVQAHVNFPQVLIGRKFKVVLEK